MDPNDLFYFQVGISTTGGIILGIIGAYFKFRKDLSAALAQAVRTTTPQELEDLINQVKAYTDASSPGGTEITDDEALRLGVAVWAIFGKK